MPLTGDWLGRVLRIDGGLAWQFRLQEDGMGNVSGTVSRTDFSVIPGPNETISPGTVEGVHAASEIRLILDYGSNSEAYEGALQIRRPHRGVPCTRDHRAVRRGAGTQADRAGLRRVILVTGGERLCRRPPRSGARRRWSPSPLPRPQEPQYLAGRFSSRTDVVAGDVLDPDSLREALRGTDTAYYLVHSMGSRDDFGEQDRAGARNFARAAREQGVRRVIYLGGLAGDGPLSPHLASRLEVGRILASEVPTLEFRASIIIGSGSLSFELLRNLVNKLPVMVTPRWVGTPAQPIAIDDVIAYLIHGLDIEHEGNAVFEIGGPRRVTYGELMREYARQAGVRRVMIPVPLLSPRLSSLWLGLVTPVYARVGRKLVTSLRNETIVRDTAALERFRVRPLPVGEGDRPRAARGGPGDGRDALE